MGTQQFEQGVLRQVGVLEFIHQHVLEAAGISLRHAGLFCQQARRQHQQVIKIDRVAGGQQFLVAFVDAGDHLVAVGAQRHVTGQQQVVLGGGDGGVHPGGAVGLIVNIQFADGAFDQRNLVISVKNDEVGFVGQVIGLSPQEAGAHGVEGTQPDALEVLLHHVDHAVLHFTGSLVGKGNSDDVVCRHAAALDEVRQAAGEHARFAGTGTRQHQHLAVRGGHRAVLLRVKVVKQGVRHGSIHPARRVQAEVVDAVDNGVLLPAARAVDERGCVRQRRAASRAGEESACRGDRSG